MADAPQLYMVFDVESVGLHGEGYAVGWVVIDRHGKEMSSYGVRASPKEARGSETGRKWVAENACPDVPGWGGDLSEAASAFALRREFWSAWLYWKAKGALLVADCGWPVEARFLAACVDDGPADREWAGPYPLHELATFRLAAGFDPLATVERRPEELPEHDPLADARQSARLLVEALGVLGGRA